MKGALHEMLSVQIKVQLGAAYHSPYEGARLTSQTPISCSHMVGGDMSSHEQASL